MILTDEKILTIMGDPNFYREVPEFLFCAEEAEKLFAEYRKREKDPEGCTSCDARKLLSPLTHVFRRQLVALERFCLDTGGLNKFIRYITKKNNNVRPAPIRMKYRENNEVKELVL